MSTFGKSNPLKFAWPVIAVGSVIVVVSILTLLRRCYHRDRFISFERSSRPRFDIDRHQPQDLQTVMPGPYYPTYGHQLPQTQLLPPPPIYRSAVQQISSGYAARPAQITVPLSAPPTVTPYISSSPPSMAGDGAWRDARSLEAGLPPAYSSTQHGIR